ncbi:unnamed protein product [Pipistrellus nathusii]|uniref:Homeobox domain-containing protein n=1 Tax=Pipistrellus nathusii TaxID=59473 RepID=A0ABN9ZG29_PIPNA
MQEPESPKGAPPSPARPKKKRQKRTVYTEAQLMELEEFFKRKHYGTYDERVSLATRLNLQEHQVQVWFKNRRAKERKLQRLREEQDPGAPTEPEGRGIYPAAPVPVPAGPAFQGDPELPPTPVFPEEPVFPNHPQHYGGPGFYSSPPPTHLQVSPEAESCVYNYNQACWDPAQNYPAMVPTAPVPAPAQAEVLPQLPYNISFNATPVMIPAEPRPRPLEGYISSCQPWPEEEEDTCEYLNL